MTALCHHNARIANRIDKYSETAHRHQRINILRETTLLRITIETTIEAHYLNGVTIKLLLDETTVKDTVDKTTIGRLHNNVIIRNNIPISTVLDRNITIEAMTSDNKVTVVEAGILRRTTEVAHHVEVCNHTEAPPMMKEGIREDVS